MLFLLLWYIITYHLSFVPSLFANFFFLSALLWACLFFSHFLSRSRRIHFYFVIRLLKSLLQSLSREQGFSKNISWALRMSFLCCSLIERWGENGNYCHGSGPGNERTYMSREIKYKLEGRGLCSALSTTATRPPPSLPGGKQERKVLGCLPTLPCWQFCSF